jgi:hypothetical protein
MNRQLNESNNKNTQLTIKYLINLLNDQKSIEITKTNYLIDSYPTLKLDSVVSYDTLLSGIMTAYKKASYKLNENNFKIYIDEESLKGEKQQIEKFIFNSTIDSGKKKKYIAYINSQSLTSSLPQNENILVLTYYYGINLLIYNEETQTTKCFYYDNYLDSELPFIIIKETKDVNSPNQFYEILFSQNQYIFNYSHPIVSELLPTAFIIGLEQNKQLEYLPVEKKNDQIQNGFDDYHSNKKQIVLKSIPSYVNKLILEQQTTNYKLLK